MQRLEQVIGFSKLKEFLKTYLLPRMKLSDDSALPGAAIAGPIGGGKTFIFEAVAAELVDHRGGGRVEATAQRDAGPGGRPGDSRERTFERSPQSLRREAHRGITRRDRRPARAVAHSGARAVAPRAIGRPRAGDGSGPPQDRPPSPADRGARRRAVP